ncbi:MAG: TraB/GumN family protein [Chthoniobacterales bacterium]
MFKKSSSRFSIVVWVFLTLPVLISAGLQGATACVWRVTNAPAPFYLVGTIHSLSGKDYPLPKAYDQALRECQRFYFEISPIDPDDKFGKSFANAAAYRNGDDIRKHIHPQTWAFLQKRFRESNALGKGLRVGDRHLNGLQELRPWAIAYYIWGIHGYSDVSNRYGVDRHFSYQAARMGKERGGLESFEQHVDVLRGLADIDSELILLDALVRGDKRRDDFNATRAGWKHGDLAPMEASMTREREQNLGAELRLLDYRNLRWIPKIDGAIKSGIPTAIVVGTGHFCGPNNIRELLAKRGYKIEQL